MTVQPEDIVEETDKGSVFPPLLEENLPAPLRRGNPGGNGAFRADYRKITRKVYSLDTKLKDIYVNPNRWYLMLRNYTGVDIQPSVYNQRVPPGAWFEGDLASTFLDAFPVEQDDVDLSNFNEFTSLNTGDDMFKNHWFNWLKISPGLRSLLPILVDMKTTGLFDKRYILSGKDPTPAHPIAFAFMELTLAEATGLTYDRIQKIFPNMSDSFSASPGIGIILGVDYDVETQVIKKITPSQLTSPATTNLKVFCRSILFLKNILEIRTAH